MKSKKIDIDLKNRKTVIGLHILFWSIFYYLMCFLNHLAIYDVGITDKINLLANLDCLIAVILNHYLFFPILLSSIRKKKWISAILLVFLLYVFSILIANFPLYYMAHAFPDERLFILKYEYYGIQNWKDIFSYKPLLWAFSLVFFWNFASILIQTSIDLYRSQKEKLAVLQERNAMEMNFLRMQIQPHFLFNTLNNIYGMVLDNERAANSVTKLSELLRFSLNGSKKEWISLEEEMLFLRNYIDLERIRHRPEKVKIKCSFSAVDAGKIKIKPLLLVNFIENAFKHGVNASVGNSWVDIQLEADVQSIRFYIANSQPLPQGNVSSNKSIRDLKSEMDHSGIGLENVRRRLELEYFERYSLTIKETDEVYAVELTLLF
ncbi:sensor histidine kinase [Sphingobacterium anhuiense]|uniref:sensor histidine kinase n=1 Tax=Sphingobacterium anhuiense TaxID=493780 RepID=UPI003C2E05DB